MTGLLAIATVGGVLDMGGGGAAPSLLNNKVWFDFSDATTLFTDAGRTTPVSSAGDAVWGLTDKGGSENHGTPSSTVKPIYYPSVKNGRSVLQFVNSNVVTPSLASFPSKRGAIFVVYKPRFSTAAFLAATFNGFAPHWALYSALSGGTKNLYYDGTQRTSAEYDVADTWYLKVFWRDGDTTAKHRRNKVAVDSLTVGNSQPVANPLYVGNSTVGSGMGKLIGEFLLFDDMTQAHMLAWEDYLYNKWDIASQNDTTPVTMLAVGDSITAGTGASDAAHRWTNLVKAAGGYDVLYNNGVSGTVLQNTVQNTVAVIGGAVTSNLRDNRDTRISYYSPDYLFILYGLNDLRLNDAAFTSALFQNDLQEIVQQAKAYGTPAAHIVIGSPPYIPAASYTLAPPWDGATAGKFTDYIAACAAVATAEGTKYIDVNAWMIANGGDTLIGPDGIHPNDAGHDAIADAFLSVL